MQLINIEPGAVRVEKSDVMGERPRYWITGKTGGAKEFPAESILHLQGPSWNGSVGMDVMRQAREAIGLSIATEEAHARLHSNGARPGGMLSVEGSLKDDQFKALRKWIEENYAGGENAYRTSSCRATRSPSCPSRSTPSKRRLRCSPPAAACASSAR